MSENKIRIEDHSGNIYYPHTKSDVVFMKNGKSVEDEIVSHKTETADDDVHGLGNQRGLVSSGSDTGFVGTPHSRVIISCSNSRSSNTRTLVAASDNSESSNWRATVLSSLNVQNNIRNSVAGGTSTDDISANNRKWHIFSETGNIQIAGQLTPGHSFADFAEVFPNLTKKVQEYGLLQTIDGFGVRPAQEGEKIVGVTSATAGIILGDTPFSWQGRSLKDEWGAYIYETIPNMDYELKEGETEEDRPLITIPKQNPEWNQEEEQKSRIERSNEWTVVGLIGQVYVRLKEDVEVMDYVKAWQNGIGQKSTEDTNIQVMKITQAYNAEKGYKIGFCLLK